MNAGTALIKPTNFLFLVTRTPTCQFFSQPGGCNALLKIKFGKLFFWKIIIYT